MSDVDTAEETAPEVEMATPARRANRGLRLAVIALAALSLGLGVLAATQSSQRLDTEDRDAAVRRTSAAMGTAMLSYDYKHLEESKSRVLALATGKFKDEYAEAFNSSLDELYKRTEGVATVREVKVYVGDVTNTEATAIVEVDYLASGLAGKNRPNTVFLELSLVHSDDGWLVDNVRAIQTPEPAAKAETQPTPE